MAVKEKWVALEISPIDIVAAMRIGIKDAERRFTRGGCFQLYKILKFIFPEAVAWIFNGHIYTKIGDCFYDINGEHREIPAGAFVAENEPMIFAKAHEWDFS